MGRRYEYICIRVERLNHLHTRIRIHLKNSGLARQGRVQSFWIAPSFFVANARVHRTCESQGQQIGFRGIPPVQLRNPEDLGDGQAENGDDHHRADDPLSRTEYLHPTGLFHIHVPTRITLNHCQRNNGRFQRGVPPSKGHEKPTIALGRFNLYCVRFLLPRVPLSALQSAWPIAGATAKRSLGVPCSTSATTTPPNEFGGGTRDDVRVDTVLIKMP